MSVTGVADTRKEGHKTQHSWASVPAAHDSGWGLPGEGWLATQQVPEAAHTWETSRFPAA